LFLLLSLISKNKWIVVSCFIGAALVALSRVYLTAHFVRDIYWGMIFGVETTSIILFLFRKKML
jgi:membrane-associated phospholipid phosphatase